MTRLRSSKLLVDKFVLIVFLFAPVACYHANHTSCEKDEELDDQEHPDCCNPNLMLEDFHGKKCLVMPSDSSVGVAITLIMSFVFLISLQCFMNHPKIEMRESAYNVISSTVSIFSAVLTFQSFNGLVSDNISLPLQKATGWEGINVAVDLAHTLLWYVATQLTIAFVSKAFKSTEWRQLELAKHSDAHMELMINIKINSTSYGIVLAHLTGFAAINFWTDMQQIDPFKRSPLLALAPLPLAVFLQLVLERITDICRQIYIACHGEKDFFEKLWDEKCQEAEDDIMGLTLSVLIVNSLRYAINDSYGQHCLPNSEQKEEGEHCEFTHSLSSVFVLLGFGLVFVALLFSTKWIIVKISTLQKIADQDEESSCYIKSTSVFSTGSVPVEEKSKFEEIIERLENVVLTTLGMSFSWCVFHGCHQLLKVLNPRYLGEPQNSTELSVVLAFGATYIATFIIRVLDALVELPDKWRPYAFEESIKSVVNAMSVFIGFAWEQTFDESVDQLAEITRLQSGPHGPPVAKLLLGGVCTAVVFCAWKWYILPFVFKKGWRFGYIFSAHDLQARCHELAAHDKKFHIGSLHKVAESLAQSKLRHMRTRFSFSSKTEHPVELPQHGQYKPLAQDDSQALREEIHNLKICSSNLEQQLAEERGMTAELRISQISLEKQLQAQSSVREQMKSQDITSEPEEQSLVEEQLKSQIKALELRLASEKKSREDLEKTCESVAEEFAQQFIEGKLLEEMTKAQESFKKHCQSAGVEFFKRHLVEEKTAGADFGIESWPTACAVKSNAPTVAAAAIAATPTSAAAAAPAPAPVAVNVGSESQTYATKSNKARSAMTLYKEHIEQGTGAGVLPLQSASAMARSSDTAGRDFADEGNSPVVYNVFTYDAVQYSAEQFSKSLKSSSEFSKPSRAEGNNSPLENMEDHTTPLKSRSKNPSSDSMEVSLGEQARLRSQSPARYVPVVLSSARPLIMGSSELAGVSSAQEKGAYAGELSPITQPSFNESSEFEMLSLREEEKSPLSRFLATRMLVSGADGHAMLASSRASEIGARGSENHSSGQDRNTSLPWAQEFINNASTGPTTPSKSNLLANGALAQSPMPSTRTVASTDSESATTSARMKRLYGVAPSTVREGTPERAMSSTFRSPVHGRPEVEISSSSLSARSSPAAKDNKANGVAMHPKAEISIGLQANLRDPVPNDNSQLLARGMQVCHAVDSPHAGPGSMSSRSRSPLAGTASPPDKFSTAMTLMGSGSSQSRANTPEFEERLKARQSLQIMLAPKRPHGRAN